MALYECNVYEIIFKNPYPVITNEYENHENEGVEIMYMLISCKRL